MGQVGIGVYILHRKYQVKPHSCQWFAAAFAAAIFHLYQKDKSSDSKVKGFLKLPDLDMLIKQNSPLLPRNICSCDFGGIANCLLNKGKSAIPPFFSDQEVFSSTSNKAKLFAESFSKNSNLDN